MTNVELARHAGISAPPCLRRVRALEENGFIHGYYAQLDAESLGYEVLFYVLVGLDSQHDNVLSGFEELMSGWKEVRECHMVRGAGDFLLKVVARNTAHENELTTRLTSAPHVDTVQTISGHPHVEGDARRARGHGTRRRRGIGGSVSARRPAALRRT